MPGPPEGGRRPRASGREAEYELLLEMILEGSLLHYGEPRVVHTSDRDLALLLGDQLYALGWRGSRRSATSTPSRCWPT